MKPIAEHVRAAIRRDREGGTLLPELVRTYGVSKATVWNIIKDIEAPAGAHCPPPPRQALPESLRAPKSRRPSLSKFDLGRVGCMMAEARLLLAGYEVFAPRLESTPVDLLVGTSLGLRRVQVKVAWEDSKRGGLWIASLQSTDPGKAHAKPCKVKYYSPAEVEFFLVYCQGNDSIYVVENLEGRRELRMWVDAQRFGQNQHTKDEVDPETFRGAFNLMGEPLRV